MPAITITKTVKRTPSATTRVYTIRQGDEIVKVRKSKTSDYVAAIVDPEDGGLYSMHMTMEAATKKLAWWHGGHESYRRLIVVAVEGEQI